MINCPIHGMTETIGYTVLNTATEHHKDKEGVVCKKCSKEFFAKNKDEILKND